MDLCATALPLDPITHNLEQIYFWADFGQSDVHAIDSIFSVGLIYMNSFSAKVGLIKALTESVWHWPWQVVGNGDRWIQRIRNVLIDSLHPHISTAR